MTDSLNIVCLISKLIIPLIKIELGRCVASCPIVKQLKVVSGHLCRQKMNGQVMEVFSSRRRRLYRPMQKAVVFMLNPLKNYVRYAWQNSIVV